SNISRARSRGRMALIPLAGPSAAAAVDETTHRFEPTYVRAVLAGHEELGRNLLDVDDPAAFPSLT
ncbi:MAG TPA: hypothetical protein VLI67_02865, partial [Vicinamibacteria bacterium]|nr:hypothetical protein [Vicinamibacteria bacterium]